MNCRKAKDLITIGVFGRFTSEQKEELESHLKSCSACRCLYAKSAPLIDSDREEKKAPSPNLEKSWQVISEKALNRRKTFRTGPFRKWALAAVSLLVVFALGYFAGKRVLPSKEDISRTPAPSLTAYADNLRPVLINFLNRGEDESENIRMLESRIISDMLHQTRMLKNLAPHSGGCERLDLLRDLEFILVSLDNLNPGDREAARQLAFLIREKNISLRLQELVTVNPSI